MQTTSTLWRELYEAYGTTYEYKFEINGVTYGEDVLISHSVESSLYEDFGIGNASTAELKLSLLASDIPRGATVKRFIRLVNGDRVSEWLQKGVFFINRRGEEDGLWTIEAFDAMRKAERIWVPDPEQPSPMKPDAAVREFARLMGVEVDDRTWAAINMSYGVEFPTNDYTIRQELQFIAAASGGNFIMSDESKLLLVGLLSFPPETHYLIEQHGSAITFGGVRILV